MDKAAIFELYDRTVRRNPGDDASSRTERVGGMIIVAARFRFVSWWDFDDDGAGAVVDSLVNELRDPGQPLIWRIYEQDGPPSLVRHLSGHGFIPQDPGRLMVSDLEAFEAPAGQDMTIRVITDAQGLADWNRVNTAAFGYSWAREDEDGIQAALADRSKLRLIAYDGDTPVGSSALWTPPGLPFCGLLGGGVIADARGRGVYRAMTDHRLRLARERGYRYAAVDANGQSGPRLERMGFTPITSETTWLLDVPT